MLVHRYFSPDTPPYASILRGIAEHLGESGYRVTVLTCQPSYNRKVVRRAPAREELAGNVTVVRWPVLDDRRSSLLKGFNLVWFCVLLMVGIPRLGRVDAIMAASAPPIAVAGTVSWLARRKGAAFIYHKQDIHPEVTFRPERPAGWLQRLLRAIDRRTDRLSSRVVVLSRDMADTVHARGVDRSKIRVINNFDPWLLDEPGASGPGPDLRRPAAAGSSSPELTVVFAGGLGRFQGLETVFAAMVELCEEPVRFHFFGDGPLRPVLEQLIQDKGLRNVEVHGYRAPADVASFLSEQADVGIVSLAPGVIRAAYPSKTMSYLRQGTPLLAMVEDDSELAETVRGSRTGTQVEPEDVSGLVQALLDLSRDPSRLEGASERALQLYCQEFGRDRRLADWTALFAEVAA